MEKETRRWPIALIVIVAVVIISAAMIYSYREAPGRLPVSAISDSSGGAIIAWQNEDGIYAQHINPSGQPLWEKGDLLVSKVRATFDIYSPPQTYSTLTADGSSGAIITWEDRSQLLGDRDDPGYYDPVPVYSQRISSNGELLWGSAVITGKTERIGGSFPEVVRDGTGGAIFAWNDYKTYYRALHDDYLRLQKLAPDGRPLWGDEGVLVITSSPYRPLTEEEIASGIKGTIGRSRPTYYGRHTMVSDGAEGVIVFWEEEEADNSNTIYAQRVDGESNPVWPEKVLVGTGQSYSIQSVASDGEGGAIIAISGSSPEAAYVQRLGGDGELLWSGGGTIIPSEYSPNMISDGLGGAILFRSKVDPPGGPPWERRHSLLVQRLNQDGQTLWQEKPVFTTERDQYYALDITTDGSGGVILAWRLYRQEFVAYGEVFAQRLDATGNALWLEDGVAVFTDSELEYQGTPKVIGDGSGGAIVIAPAGKSALRGDVVYAQRLDMHGSRLWGSGIRIDR